MSLRLSFWIFLAVFLELLFKHDWWDDFERSWGFQTLNPLQCMNVLTKLTTHRLSLNGQSQEKGDSTRDSNATRSSSTLDTDLASKSRISIRKRASSRNKPASPRNLECNWTWVKECPKEQYEKPHHKEVSPTTYEAVFKWTPSQIPAKSVFKQSIDHLNLRNEPFPRVAHSIRWSATLNEAYSSLQVSIFRGLPYRPADVPEWIVMAHGPRTRTIRDQPSTSAFKVGSWEKKIVMDGDRVCLALL